MNMRHQRDCKHGQLARSCEICSLEDDVAKLTEERDALQACAKTLYRHCVSLMESGRDIIIAEGGQCDSVAVMEMSDPWLAEARKTLKGKP